MWCAERWWRWVASGTAVFAVSWLAVGCSCRTTKEFDSGLGQGRSKRSRDDHRGQHAGASPPGPTGGTTAGTRDTGGAGGGGESGSGAGGARAGSGGGAGDPGAGAAQAGSGGGGSKATAAGASAAAAGSDDGDSAVPGGDSDGGSGVADAPDQPAAALPGRRAAGPRYTAEQAVPVAQAALEEAAAAERRDDFASAYDAALRGYEAVLPHAAADETCGALATRAGRLLKNLAERQNRTFEPQPVETIFR